MSANSRGALLTAYDRSYQSFADRALPGFRKLAAFSAIDLKVITEIPKDRPAVWQKLRFIDQLFEEGYDFVLWVDIDCLVVRLENVRSVIRDHKDFYASDPGWDGGDRLIEFESQMNCGVMLWRKTDWSWSFLDLVWRQEQFVNQRWEEQAAIMHLLGYRSWLDPAEKNELDHARLEKVQRLPTDWNCVSGFVVSANPIIMHFAGNFREPREAAMTRLAKELPQLWEMPKGPRRKILFDHGCRQAADVLQRMEEMRIADVRRLEDDVKRLKQDQVRRDGDAERMMLDVVRIRAETDSLRSASLTKGGIESASLQRIQELTVLADETERAAQEVRDVARQNLEKFSSLLAQASLNADAYRSEAASLLESAERARLSRAHVVPLSAFR